MSIRNCAIRYIKCNLPNNQKIIENGDIIDVYFNGRVEFVFYLEDTDKRKAGEYTRDNPSLGHYPDKSIRSFTDYDYAAAMAWDLANAGVEISPSY